MTAARRKSKTLMASYEGEVPEDGLAQKKNITLSDGEDPQEKAEVAPVHEGDSYLISKVGNYVADESCEGLLLGSAIPIVDAVINRALAGNMPAANMLLERILPDPSNRLFSFDLREIKCVDDALAASSDVLTAVAQGKINLHEAQAVTNLLQIYINNNAQREFAKRLSALEEIAKKHA
jgi:hypothetical protein